ncbi:MAG: SdrD B-like domain-containing protein, partial [Patescibacteria group bacterium]
CTFTNTVQNGSITVTKQTTPDGSPQSFTFNLGGNATDSASLTDGQSHTFGDLLPGSYSLGEIIPSGWQFTSATCDNNNFSNDGTISLSPAQNVSCVFNNTQLGTMKVKKVMVGDTGSFTFTGDVAGTISTNNGEITVNNVVPGSYSSIESAISGWDLTGISCDDANSTGDKSTGTASFKVEANETVTCTFTNTKKRDITACKFDDMNGNGVKDDGDSLLDGWDMTLTPGDVTQSTVSGCTTFSDLLPGQYSIAETLKTDWLNTTDLSQNVTLTANQNEKIYFGNFQCATISGTKWEDLNGNGVKDSGEPTLPDWTINLGGQKTNSTTTNADGNYSFKVCNGGSYTISEDFPNTDWYQTYPGGTSPNHQVTVTSGGSYTGKDFGNAKYAKISGIKYRDNDGDGVLDANDLTDTLAGWVFDLYDGVSNAVLSTYTTLANGFYEFTGLFAGHSYYVKEQQKTGWTQTIGSPSPTPMTLQSGDDKKVNFANYENVSIKVCKEEDRDGDIRSSDDRSNVQGWSMTLYDNAVQVGSAQVTGTDGCYTWSNLGPGNYSVSEETRTGWTNLNNTSHGFGTLQSGSGESSWTFVNSRLGKVIVKKVMIGGTDTFDFTGDALGSIGTNNGTIELDNVIPGSDPASVESAKAGWDLTNITCDDTDSIPDLPTRTVIFRVGSGETVTCTFTNSKLPTLTLTKTVVNNNGGTAIANDFQGKINGDNVSWSTAKTLTPGSYTASETTLSNYTASEWGTDCNANGNITLAYGDNKTCSITNNDNAPALHLRKTITNDNGGTATVDDFTLTANGTGTNDISGTSPVDSDATLKADTFALSESSLAGYTAGSWDCGRATMTDPTHVVVPFGGDVTCTLNNNDDAPSLTLVKEVEGGSNEPADWTLTADGPTGFSGTGPTVDNGTSFDAGTYNLSESGPSGYTASNWVCTGGNQTDGDTVVIGLGENVTCTITNTRDIGSLEVNKQVDTNGDGVFEGGNTEANGLGFVWGIDSEIPARSMGSTASSLDTGSYNVNENNDVANYHFVGWFYNGSDFSCEDPENSELPALINVSKGSTTSITLCNARDMGTITVDKVTDPSEAPDEFTINLSQGLLENPTLIHSSVLADQTTPDTYTIPTGEYWFQELAKTGWDLTDATCTDGEESFDPRADSFNLTTDVNLTCTFTNTQRGKVIVTKYSDNNGNGQRDEGENTLSDWVINFNKNSQTTDNNGQTIFNNVVPGTYDLSETMKDGYIQTELSCFDREFRGEDNLLSVRVGPGSDIDCQIGNQPINPKLQISKSNNGVDNSRGGSVIYTLIVNALDGKVLGVKVKDLLPKGFNFQNVISIIRTNSVNPLINDDITALVGDPLYHSPGTYNLGDMNQDDIITIKYQAMIDGSQAYGLYKDIAWAEGTNLLGTKVLASAQDGKVDDYFVGTSVRINGNLTQEGKIEGEVLGASTSLPATGANPAWLIIALMLTIFGALTVALGFMFKKGKMILTILTLFAGSLLIVNSTYAADVSIRLSEPKTPTRINNFTVDFVALDLSDSGNPLTVKCFYKKNLGDGWTQYGPDITVAAPGNNGSCQEVSSIVNTSEKTYYFKATVNGIDSETTVAVGYDDRDPSVPTTFSKEKIGDCQYKVTFKTADDGQTSRVEVYRSSSTSFNLDGGTRVADISIGPNTEGSFTDSVPDCSKTYYYVVRAFNSAGNASGSNGDSVTVSSSSTATTSITEGGAIPVSMLLFRPVEKKVKGRYLEKKPRKAAKLPKKSSMSISQQ